MPGARFTARTLRRAASLAACTLASGIAGAGQAQAQPLVLSSEDNPHRLAPLRPLVPGGPLFPREGGRLPYGLSDTAWASTNPARRLSAEELARIHQAIGGTIARVPVFWPQVEPEPGAREWALYDDLYRELIRHGVRPLWTIYQTPRHAVEVTRQGRCRGSYCDTEPAAEHLGLLATFARQLAERFPLSAAFEYRNEPNVSRDAPVPMIAPERYVAGLRAMHRGVKAASPQHRVLGLALAIDDGYETYLDAALAAGAGGVMDGLSFHPYWTDHRADTLALMFGGLRDVLGRHGATGLRLVPDEAGASTTQEKHGLRFDEVGQRDRMMAWFLQLDRADSSIPLSSQVDAAIMFTTVDGGPDDGFGGYGWFRQREDGVLQPKLVLCTFRERIAGIATLRASGPFGGCPGNYPGRRVKTPAKKVMRSCPSKRSKSGKPCRCRSVTVVVKGKRKRTKRCGYVTVKPKTRSRRRPAAR